MGVASGCGEQEVGVASGSGWNLWVWLLGVVLRRYIDFLILLIPTPLVSVLFGSSIPTSVFILLKLFCFLYNIYIYISSRTSCHKCFHVILNIRSMQLAQVYTTIHVVKMPHFTPCIYF